MRESLSIRESDSYKRRFTGVAGTHRGEGSEGNGKSRTRMGEDGEISSSLHQKIDTYVIKNWRRSPRPAKRGRPDRARPAGLWPRMARISAPRSAWPARTDEHPGR
jgi:hypothetical protein